MNRRTFLRGLGGITLWLPALESLVARKAWAASTPPRRIVVYFECNGVNMATFFPKLTATGPLTSASLTGTALEPLIGHIPSLLVPRGWNMSPRGWAGVGCDHKKGMGHKLTAAPLIDDSNNYASGPSVDQVLARAKNPAGRGALSLAVGGQGNDVLSYISYSAANTPVKGENNPWYAYRNFMTAGMMGGTGGPGMIDVAAKRKSVLDLVQDDMDTLRATKLSALDKQKLDLHFTIIRELEQSATTTIDAGTGGGSVQACSLAMADASTIQALNGVSVTGDSYFKTVSKMQCQVMALALACNYTVSGTLLFGRGSGGPTYNWDGMTSNYPHHPLSHRSTTDSGTGDIGNVALCETNLTQIDTWHAKQFCYLLDLLKAYTDVDGSSVLSNTAAVWINELSDGKAHDWQDLPVVIGGGLGGYLKQGQFVNIRGDNTAPAATTEWTDYNSSGNINQPHNMLWTTLLNGAGVPTTQFGATGDNARPGEVARIKA